MDRLQYGADWRITRHNEYERWKVKHRKPNGKWELMITHDDIDFIKAWLCAEGVLRRQELSSEALLHLAP